MGWSIYERPDGEQVQVWHVTDPAVVPGGVGAGFGQVVVREVREDPEDGHEYQAEYVLDEPNPEWELISELPDDVAADEPIPAAEDPRADLWAKGEDELVAMANHLGITVPEGETWIKRQYVHAIHEARSAAPATAAALTGEASTDLASHDEVGFDPASHNIDEVHAYLAEHPEEREAVLEAERARGDEARSTLIAALQAANEGSVEEILARVGDDVEAAKEVLEAEQAEDEPRSTLVEPLEKLIAGVEADEEEEASAESAGVEPGPS